MSPQIHVLTTEAVELGGGALRCDLVLREALSQMGKAQPPLGCGSTPLVSCL